MSHLGRLLGAVLLLCSATEIAVASQCAPTWSFPLPNQLRQPDIETKLGPEHWQQLQTYETQSQWAIIMAGAHIIIEATPVRMVLLKKRPGTTPRMVITYRDVTWLRDLRQRGRRPTHVALGVSFSQEVDNTSVSRERRIKFEPKQHLLPGNPQRRYTLLLRQERASALATFDNAVTERPLASLGDPTNGCTSAFIIEHADQATNAVRNLSDHGMRALQGLRVKPELH
jgi:hypothetical protein